MAHELLIEDGRASMMYVDGKPWHGLGTRLAGPATAEEAIDAANLGWEVVKRPLYTVGDGALHAIKDKMAIMRRGSNDRSDGPVFGLVGKNYTPLQNREAFAFFDDIVGTGAAIYHTAGALGQGERIWVLAKLPDSIQVINDDIAEKYLLLSNSHDANSSVQIKFTPIRVVCQNTLTLALREGRTIRVAHTRDLHVRLRQAEDLLGLVTQRFLNIAKSFRQMVRVQVGNGRLDEYLRLVFPEPLDRKPSAHQRTLFSDAHDDPKQRAKKRVENNRRWSRHFFENGRGNQQKGVRGTLWAAYNGIAEMIDHRQTGLNDERRLRSIWFGHGYRVKARAYTVACEKLKSWN